MSQRKPAAPWWQTAVFYQIYPRSFQDSNGDGIGDLPGITRRLDDLVDLGIDALWITPFYPSPQVDFGYDVSDYLDVDPQFGTLEDFDCLLAAAHARGIRVTIDFVMNHTSDRHPWFVESRASRHGPRRDWYIWRDPKPDGSPPNNWSSAFGPVAWTLDEATQQYYYHYFYPQQPDLNWRNPDVEKAMFDVARFWLDRGVDGFRLDAVNTIYEDPGLSDNPLLPDLRPGSTTEREQNRIHNRNLPEVHPLLQRLRAVSDTYPGDRVLVGEAYVPAMAQLMAYYGRANDELHLPFNFFFTLVPTLSAEAFRKQVVGMEAVLRDADPACRTCWVLSNHDIPRAVSRYAHQGHHDDIARLLGMMLLTLRGTPFIYYGEEIGMENHDPQRIEDVQDPVGRVYWPARKGRDGERTPMQWDPSPGAGFTTGKPWLPLAPTWRERNVQAQRRDPRSVWSFYKRAIALRRASPALLDGAWRAEGSSPEVFAYWREAPQQRLLVLLNMGPRSRTINLERPMRVVLDTAEPTPDAAASRACTVGPYQGCVLE